MSVTSLIAKLTSVGPVGVFVIFLLPWGPGAPAGILLARKEGMSPALMIVLYVLSDVVTAILLEPLIRLLRSRGDRSLIGRKILATFNRLGSVTRLSSGRLGLPFGLFTFTFATDFFSASVVSTGIPLGRLVAWTCIIAGDVLWFLIILLAMLGIAAFLPDDRVLFIATMVLGFALPPLLRKILRQGQTAGDAPR